MSNVNVEFSHHDEIVKRLVDIQERNLDFFTRELEEYHVRYNQNSPFSKMPFEEKRAWTKYELDYLALMYASNSDYRGAAWEKNLASSTSGAGYRGINEVISGMLIVSYLLVPLVRDEFVGDPVSQTYALSLVSNANQTLIRNSLGVYEGYVLNACEDVMGSRACCLDDVPVGGYQVEETNRRSVGDFRFTEREVDVLHLIGLGYENCEICAALRIKLDTVKSHVRNIMQKASLHNRTQLALLAMNIGLCKRDDIDAALERAYAS